MKIYKNRIIGLLVLLLMVSCALESKFGLPNDEKIKSELIGEWFNEDNRTEIFKVLKNSEITYKILITDKEKTEEVISYSKTINGFNIMNIKTEYEGVIKNIFYGFKVKGNTLLLSDVNEKLRNKEFEFESELLRFFQNNISNKDFFINQYELKRK